MNNESNLDFIAFLRTILMILENHNFCNTVEIFKKECLSLGYHDIFIGNTTTETETKSVPKIMFESLSKNNPCRIIIENENISFIHGQNNIKVNTNSNSSNTSTLLKLNDNITQGRNFAEKIIGSTNNAENTNEKNFEEDYNLRKKSCETYKITDKPLNSTPATIISGEIDNQAGQLDLKGKFCMLQKDHRKLMDVVTQLTFALQTSVKGELDNTRTILDKCKKMYPDIFYKSKKSSKTQIVCEKEAQEGKEKSMDLMSYMNGNPYCRPFFKLDYQRIKYDLKHGDLNIKILLLQALRWRITKTPPELRDIITRIYMRFDILNVHNCSHKVNTAYPKNSVVFITFCCTCNSPETLQQAVARFTNALASTKTGRDYIEHQSVILSILLSVLLESHPSTSSIDHITRDMIIATLQKMSLRYAPRMIMISGGLVEHMVKFLCNNLNTISVYCLEYSVALLRNLWLHTESREKCYPLANDVLILLRNLLDERYIFCLPYITGCFYNLFTDNFYNQSAKSNNFEEIFLHSIERLQGDLKEQMQYILDIYLNPANWRPLCECDLSSDTENEIDIIEPEIDQNEMITTSTLNGEHLLSNYSKLLTFNGSLVNFNSITSMFSTPVTPNVCNMASSVCDNDDNQENDSNETESIKGETNIYFTNESEHTEEINLPQDKECNESLVENKEIVMSPCDDTQQFCYELTKNGIFESNEAYMLRSHSSSVLKNISEYDIKNISKSLPVSARNKIVHSASSIVRSERNMTNKLSPMYGGTCYRDGFKMKTYSSGDNPDTGICVKTVNKYNASSNSKYSCDCFVEMKKSMDENSVKANAKLNKISIKNELSNINFCKYKCYPTSTSAPLPSTIKLTKDSTTSKSLNEGDYTSVFESRPRILRTP